MGDLPFHDPFRAIIEAIYGSTTDKAALQVILSEAVRASVASSGLIQINHDDDHPISNTTVTHGLIANDSTAVSASRGICSYVALNNIALAVPDTSKESRCSPFPAHVHSQLCIPIRLRTTCVGVICLDSSNTGHFRPDDGSLTNTIELFAYQAAIVVLHSNLFAELHDLRSYVARNAQIITAAGLISTMAHELKNGLIAISVFAQKLQFDRAVSSSQENQRRLTSIREDADKLSRFASILLDTSRLSTGAKAAISLNKIIEMHLDINRDILQNYNLRVSVSYDPCLDDTFQNSENRILADENQIGRVFTELIWIIMRQSGPRQTIYVQTRNLSNTHVSFAVQGFVSNTTENLNAEIFGPKLVVETHYGGSIKTTSEAGRATRLEVVLPKHTQGISNIAVFHPDRKH